MTFLPTTGIRHWLPLGFVIVLLFALVAIPIVSERRIRSYETALNEVVEPARARATDLHLAHGVAGGALREYLTSGAPGALARYEEAVQAEQQALRQLEPLIRQLPGPVRGEFEVLRLAVRRWRSEVAEVLDAPPADLGDDILLRFELNEQALIAAARLDRELARVGESLRLQVRSAKQSDIIIAGILLLLAVIAASVVGWAGRRLHRNAVIAEQARRDVVSVNESRARLIRGFSHDVKNPLGGADGYAQLLEERILGPLNEDQARGVRRLRASLRAALDLIDDLVDLARAEAGQIDLRVERFDLAQLVQELVEEYGAAAEAKGLDLTVRHGAEPVRVESDRPRVRQILSNLFSNAVKYTPQGGSVRVDVSYAPARRQPDPQRWVLVCVEDTGPGIPSEQQQLIFREFTRLDPTETHGAGLGLAISQGLAHALGGQITVRSEVGRGSTFMMWLPDSIALTDA